MSMALPRELRDKIRQQIWNKATELSWPSLSDIERAIWYENWSKDKEIGEVLAHFMDPRKVRVYIKDSLLKPYLRHHLKGSLEEVLLAIGIEESETQIIQIFSKPHGCKLICGKIICWGNSRDWKAILMSVYERAYRLDTGIPFAAVLIESGRTVEVGLREMITDVSSKLQLEKVVWIEQEGN